MSPVSSDMQDVPVLIVGGGPVGLGLAIELGQRGVECVLVEQGDGTLDHPRANTVNSRTMEFCRRWGIADEVRHAGAPPDFPQTVLYLTGLQGHELARIERPSHGGNKPLPTTPERSQRCNQLWFDPILRRRAASFANVSLVFRTRFERFEETADGVRAQVRDLATDQLRTIVARYVVLCCGGGSGLPAAMGIGMEGTPVVSHHLNVFLRIKDLEKRHDKGLAAFYFFVTDVANYPSLIELDGRELWRLGLNFGDDRPIPEAVDVDSIVGRVIGPGIPYEVISRLPWTCRSIVADRWQQGRVLLAGDAVHQHGPTGGFGMNTGMGDATNLGWKLEAMLRGWGGEALLDSYQIERRPVAKRNVDEATDNMGRRFNAAALAGIDDDTAGGESVRAQARQRIIAEKSKQFISDGIALGYRYDGSPVICPDGTPAPPDSTTQYVQTSRPGSRAPHAFLADGRSTIDLFGEGFVLLRFDGGLDCGGFERAARERKVPFAVVDIADPEIARLYERALVLVRPDGHVAWRGDAAPAETASIIDRVRGATPLTR